LSQLEVWRAHTRGANKVVQDPKGKVEEQEDLICHVSATNPPVSSANFGKLRKDKKLEPNGG